MSSDSNTITPAQAYERLKSLEADLNDLLLSAPTPADGPDAMEEFEEAVAWARNAISFLSNYASDEPPDLDKPF
tara:strand:- start:6437 stop:6658 length:222 start_codon:yes stop_codon:yes gene_type:complete